MVFLVFLLVKKKKKEKKKKNYGDRGDWIINVDCKFQNCTVDVRVYLYIISHGEKQMTIGSKGVVEIYIK